MTGDKIFKTALGYLAKSPKTIREMRRYLIGKHVEPRIVEAVIERLLALNYLDDRAYARQFIDNRVRFKPKSRYALGYELRGKGIAPDVADELLKDLDDVKLACSAAKKKYTQLNHLQPDALRKKILNHLQYRGFDFHVCQTVLETLIKS